MRIGYLCPPVGIRNTSFQPYSNDGDTQNQTQSEADVVTQFQTNLQALDNIIRYQIANGVMLLGLSASILPGASSDIPPIPWWDWFREELQALGLKITTSNLRILMQLESFQEGATTRASTLQDVERAITNQIRACARFLDVLGVDRTHKIVLPWLPSNFHRYDQIMKDRVVLTNGDSFTSIQVLLEIASVHRLPILYHVHDEEAQNGERDGYQHPSPQQSCSPSPWFQRIYETWRAEDGVPIFAYSQQDLGQGSMAMAPSRTIQLQGFNQFMQQFNGNTGEFALLLVTGDKNLSCIKCRNALQPQGIQALELEWSKYKYLILEYAPAHYFQIRQLLKEKNSYPILQFYDLIDEGLSQPLQMNNAINTYAHIWGYFKNRVDEEEKRLYQRKLEEVQRGSLTHQAMKNYLEQLAIQYRETYLLDSYYFAYPFNLF